jgi:hypothetical protein
MGSSNHPPFQLVATSNPGVGSNSHSEARDVPLTQVRIEFESQSPTDGDHETVVQRFIEQESHISRLSQTDPTIDRLNQLEPIGCGGAAEFISCKTEPGSNYLQ